MLVQSFLPDSFSQSEHPVTLKWYFGVQVTRLWDGKSKIPKLRPANALFFVLHFISCFHTFEELPLWKQLYLFEKRYIFSKSKVLPRAHVQLVSLSVA